MFRLAIAYVVATIAAVLSGLGAHAVLPDAHLLLYIGLADVVGTLVVFAFSRFYDNSSVYDPYWSVAPIVIVAAYLWLAPSVSIGLGIAALLVTVWGVRLTYNFLYGWPGLHHEDWRYRDFRAQFPRAYWWVSLGGIHMFPTVLVFLGCLPLYAVAFADSPPIWPLAIAGIIAALGATVIEAVADLQLHAFIASAREPGAILDTGLWRYSRHPNYFGEVGFWWGLWLFGVGISPSDIWWTLVGPVAMTLLFTFVSIPMLDRRSLERRPRYADHMKKVSGLIPLPRRD